MLCEIVEKQYTPELQEHIYREFGREAVAATGIDGLAEEPVVFEMRMREDWVGCVVVQMFWGQMHIKFLLIDAKYRGQGYARTLMERAFEFARVRGCEFAFVETMNFQAPNFYQKLGFQVEMVAEGYARSTCFYYLKKNLRLVQLAIQIKTMQREDISSIVAAFADVNWDKPVTLFNQYLDEEHNGIRQNWIAMLDNQIAGYVTLNWRSQYEPFARNQIPEIMDLNVLPQFRKAGIGSELLLTAENAAAIKSANVGLGVGLYAGADGGYGAAQRLYSKRGYLPDGNGVTYNYCLVEPGANYAVDDSLVLWLMKKLNKIER